MKAYDQPLVEEDNSYQKTGIQGEPENNQSLYNEKIQFLQITILTYFIQLTASILIGFIHLNKDVSEFLYSNQKLFWLILSVSVVVLLPIIFFFKSIKKFPLNYVLLFLFIICQGLLFAYVFNYFTWQTIIITISLVISVVISMFIYSMLLKGMLLLPVCFLILTVICMIGLIIFSLAFKDLFTRSLFSTIGVFIFGLFFIFEIKLLFGKYGKDYNKKDFGIAALSINLDLVQLFTIPLSTLRDSFEYDL